MTLLEEVAQTLLAKIRMSPAESREAAEIALEAVDERLKKGSILLVNGYTIFHIPVAPHFFASNRSWLGLAREEKP